MYGLSVRRSPGPPKGHKGCIPSGNRKGEIKHLWERHHQMKRLALLGMTHRQIAAEVGVTPQTVINVMNSAIMKKELELARAAADGETYDVMKEIRRMLPISVEFLRDTLRDEEAPIVLKAKIAMDNLSRCGYAPQVNIKGTVEHYHLTADDIDAIKRDASIYRQIALSDLNCIDVEPTEVHTLVVPSGDGDEDNGGTSMLNNS